jgi:hypothetical protein
MGITNLDQRARGCELVDLVRFAVGDVYVSVVRSHSVRSLELSRFVSLACTQQARNNNSGVKERVSERVCV